MKTLSSSLLALILVLAFTAACTAPVGSARSVPPDAAGQCASQCGEVGMALDSVVIMANNVGCVCRGRSGAPAGAAAPAGASAGGGMAAIMIAMQQQQQPAARPR